MKKFTTLLAAVSLSSCLEQESTTILSKDGSGSLTEVYTVGSDLSNAVDTEGNKFGNHLANEDTFKRFAKKMGEGVEFVELKRKDLGNDTVQTTVTYKFADINKLILPWNHSYDKNDVFTFDYVAGDTNKLTIKMPKAAGAEFERKPDEVSDAVDINGAPVDAASIARETFQTLMMFAMKKKSGEATGKHIAAFIEVDGKVTKTDADFSDGNKITLYDLDLGEIFANADAFDQHNNSDDMLGMASIIKLSKTIDGVHMDADDKILVEFK